VSEGVPRSSGGVGWFPSQERRAARDFLRVVETHFHGIVAEASQFAEDHPTLGPAARTMPSDDRARRVAADVQAAPSTAASVTRLARRAGAGRRTIERLFLAETKMTVGEWRRRARLLHGMRRLSAGASVTDAALDAGYSSVSAFIATFRKTFGVTPGRYQR